MHATPAVRAGLRRLATRRTPPSTATMRGFTNPAWHRPPRGRKACMSSRVSRRAELARLRQSPAQLHAAEPGEPGIYPLAVNLSD